MKTITKAGQLHGEPATRRRTARTMRLVAVTTRRYQRWAPGACTGADAYEARMLIQGRRPQESRLP